MCDPGEKISQTLKREFMEEATDSTGANKSSIKQIEEHLSSLFENGVEVSIEIYGGHGSESNASFTSQELILTGTCEFPHKILEPRSLHNCKRFWQQIFTSS